MSVTVLTDRVGDILAKIAQLTAADVLVGIPSDKSDRSDGPIGNAGLGYINEFGSPLQNIPARPFLQPGVKAVEEKVAQFMIQPLTSNVTVDQAFNRAGLTAAASAKKQITSQAGFAPLAASTLAARKRKGFDGTKALIQTGQLLNSITYVIRKAANG